MRGYVRITLPQPWMGKTASVSPHWEVLQLRCKMMKYYKMWKFVHLTSPHPRFLSNNVFKSFKIICWLAPALHYYSPLPWCAFFCGTHSFVSLFSHNNKRTQLILPMTKSTEGGTCTLWLHVRPNKATLNTKTEYDAVTKHCYERQRIMPLGAVDFLIGNAHWWEECRVLSAALLRSLWFLVEVRWQLMQYMLEIATSVLLHKK